MLCVATIWRCSGGLRPAGGRSGMMRDRLRLVMVLSVVMAQRNLSEEFQVKGCRVNEGDRGCLVDSQENSLYYNDCVARIPIYVTYFELL